MTDWTTDSRIPRRQLQLYVPAPAAPHLEGATREAVVRLLAALLTSACGRAACPEAEGEGRDETR
jgi:hypothetical protein